VTFTESIATCFSKYATFTGRSARPEYWWFALFTFAVSLVLGALNGFSSEGFTLSEAFTLATFVPGLAVAIRRLHDTNRSGWYLLLAIIPFGIFVLLWMLASEGSPGPNTYGETADYPIDGPNPRIDPMDPEPYR
jgi:uncharacterized membrane protein YhaH (DUF805 family)